MKKLEYLEQKIMLAGRFSLVLLGLIFLAFAIWWAALSVPDGWKFYRADDTGNSAQKMQGFTPDAKAFADAIRASQAGSSGMDEDTLKLHEAMKTPEIAAHYDNIIRTIRAFADSKPQERARIEAAAGENGDTLLAPPAFEAVDQYSTLCGDPDSTTAIAAAVEAIEAAETEGSDSPAADFPHCGQATVRAIIVEALGLVLYSADDDEAKLALHKAFIAGLDQSVSSYLDGKTPRDTLFAMTAAQISNTLVSVFQTQFSEKLAESEPGEVDSLLTLFERMTPLSVLANPFVAGTLLFLVIFVNLMMMLAVMRIGRRLDQNARL